MNDHELDRLVATAAPVRDSWVGGLDLRDAENELMEEIMATEETSATLPSGPPTKPSRPSPPAGGEPRRFKLAVAVGVAAALLVGVVLARSMAGNGGDGDDGADFQATNQQTITPMIADPVPEGFETITVPRVEPDSQPEPPAGTTYAWIYGDLTATGLTNDVVIRTSPSEGIPLPEDLPGEPVTVRGRSGLLCSPESIQCDSGNDLTTVRWTDDSGLHVILESRSFDREQVLAIAEGLVIDGDTVELGTVPAGVTKPPMVAELGGENWNAVYAVNYHSPDGRVITVTVSPETEAMRIYDLWLSGPRDDVQVQGHDAALEVIDGANVVSWQPAPGQVVEVVTDGVDQEATLAVAETVRPATEAEWAEVQELAAANAAPLDDLSPGTEPPPDDAVHRELGDGSIQVWGWLSEDGGLCYELGGQRTSQLCSGEPTSVLGVSPTNENGQLIWDAPAAVGIAPEGTESIDGGEVTFGEQVDGGRLFVWEFADGEMPDTLTFRDADGNEIATHEVLVF